ncbi:type IV toxin-antitoxin system AbiEi family antitoxin domain-containing protein [Treponema primitia]|uniref:type IV toxin-antitoxin system AbiEi family antitoxin domain-containing protein n=1 Tax=Treponema primitia TaxID=88058 RepID=UPI00397F7071
MIRLTRSIIEHKLPVIFTADDIKSLEPDDHVRYCQMSRAIASGDIVRIRRGFYTLNKIFRKAVINEHVLASLFVPTSYISFETALWDSGWIPEFVYEIASVSPKPSFEIKTPFAVYSYTRVPQKNYMAGTYTTGYTNYTIIEAKPLKALADYVYAFEYDWHSLKPLRKSLRIDIENLQTLTAADFEELEGNYDMENVTTFLEGIRKELGV